MNPFLIRAAASREERWTGERCHIRELLNDARVPELSLAAARVEPGVTTERHRLDVDECYLIRAGRGRMRVGDHEPFDVAPGDAVRIPAGTAQSITNTGPDELRFDCLCSPRFTADAYEALE